MTQTRAYGAGLKTEFLDRIYVVETCHICSGRTKIIAAIEAAHVIKKILEHLGLPTVPPHIWPARGPPTQAPDDYNQLEGSTHIQTRTVRRRS